MLSKQQELVLDTIRDYKVCSLGKLQGIYTNSQRLSTCLRRLVRLKLIRMKSYGVFEYIGGA